MGSSLSFRSPIIARRLFLIDVCVSQHINRLDRVNILKYVQISEMENNENFQEQLNSRMIFLKILEIVEKLRLLKLRHLTTCKTTFNDLTTVALKNRFGIRFCLALAVAITSLTCVAQY